MVSVSEAKDIIKAEVKLSSRLAKNLLDARGSYLAEDLFAGIDVPSFDNSAMDGYAFRFEDLQKYEQLEVVGEVPAGSVFSSLDIAEGQAVRIFTGAKIPPGVDTVVIQEKVTLTGGAISFPASEVKKGDNIRLRGSQTQKGELIMKKSTFINHSAIGFLAGFGFQNIPVYDQLKVGILVTGDELVELGNPLLDGRIYNSNSYTLQAALSEINHSCSWSHHTKDSAEDTLNAIKQAFDKADVLLITGGISVGDYDYVKDALYSIGVEELFYKIKQKPGKPLFFGKYQQKYVFALPGNPASVFTCYHQYVKPFLLGCAGRENFFQERAYARSESSAEKKNNGLTHFLKAYYEGNKVKILQGQESYKMNSAAEANCFVEFGSDEVEIKSGQELKIWKI